MVKQLILAWFVLISVFAVAQADVFNMGGTRDAAAGTWTGLASVELVTVGNPGNAPDTRYNGISVGAVPYTYQIGKYDVTAGQYTAFLNAVAATDTYQLYNTYMDNDAYPPFLSCNIKRSGSPGSYSYSVASEWANRPVNYVSWGDAARFVNWLNNGQPTGPQNLSTTEDGAYYLNGATTGSALMAVTRKTGARWVIPSEDEWYKAAYYDPDKPGGAGYWDYSTRSDTAPVNSLSSSGTNNANFFDDPDDDGNGTFTIDSPYYRTEVGAFASSPGPYGTFDQGGNLDQLTDSRFSDSRRVTRGGTFGDPVYMLAASFRYRVAPSAEYNGMGFRVAMVPEPGSLAMLFAAPLGLLAYVSRRRVQAA